MKPRPRRSIFPAQGSLEYLLLIGGVVLVAVLVFVIIQTLSIEGGGILGNNISIFGDTGGDGANPPPNMCGNGALDAGEACDTLLSGAFIFALYGNGIGQCSAYSSLYSGGNLQCVPAGNVNECQIDVSACVNVPSGGGGGNAGGGGGNGSSGPNGPGDVCGDGQVTGNEFCDPNTLNSCQSGTSCNMCVSCDTDLTPPAITQFGLASGDTQINVSYLANDPAPTSLPLQYIVLRSTNLSVLSNLSIANYDNESVYQPLGITQIVNTTIAGSFLDTSLTNGTTYHYRLRACDGAFAPNCVLSTLQSSSPQSGGQADVQPPAIAAFFVTKGDANVSIDYNAVDPSPPSNPVTYILARSDGTDLVSSLALTGVSGSFTNPPAGVTTVVPGPAPFVQSGLVNGTTYYYALRACDSAVPLINCTKSPTVSIVPEPAQETQPPVILLFTVTPGVLQNSIAYGASDPAPPSNPLTYLLAKALDENALLSMNTGSYNNPPLGVTVFTPTANPYTDANVVGGLTYYYRLRACDSALSPNCTQSGVEFGSPSGGGEDLTIVRDTWGVAHVFASTDAGAFYGMAYATAEDRMYHMEYLRLFMKGRLSEMIGNKSCTLSGCPNSVTRDIEMRHLQYFLYAERRYNELDSETKLFLQAYADGVNQYLADYQGNLLPLFGTHVPQTWEPWDSLLTWDYMTFASPPVEEVDVLHQYEDLVNDGNTPLEAATQLLPYTVYDNLGTTVKLSDVPAGTQQLMQNYANAHPSWNNLTINYLIAPPMSHGWAIGPSKTGTGESILVGDPKFKITAPGYWYEIHVKGATFNARGNTMPGTPGFFAAFTPYAAWTHTGGVSNYEDLYRLKMLGPNQYEYNLQTHNLTCTPQTIIVKNGTNQNITVCESILGPIVTPLLPNANPGEQYAFVAVPIADTGKHTVQGLIAMMRAQSLSEFTTSIGGWRTPRTNMLFATTDGHIGYWHTPALPIRSQFSPLAGFMAQDGSHSRYSWVEIMPHTLKPHVVDPADGYVFSANNMPIGNWYPIWASTMFGGGDTLRSARARELLETYAAAGNITPAIALSMHYDRSPNVFREIVRIGIYQYFKAPASFSTNAQDAIRNLIVWYNNGAQMDPNENSYALAHNFSILFRSFNAPILSAEYGESEPGMSAYARHIKHTLDTNPTYTLTAGDMEYLDWFFRDAWAATVAKVGSNPANWKTNFGNHIDSKLDAPYMNMLFDNYGSLDPTHDQLYSSINSPHGMTLYSDKGQVYSQVVNYEDVDASMALSPFGVSEDPNSGRFDNQVSLWQAGQYHDAPLSETVVELIMVSQTTLNYSP